MVEQTTTRLQQPIHLIKRPERFLRISLHQMNLNMINERSNNNGFFTTEYVTQKIGFIAKIGDDALESVPSDVILDKGYGTA